MGLFSFGKKKAAQIHEDVEITEEEGKEASPEGSFWNRGDFVFEIQRVLPYKEQGSVLIGRVHSGELLPDVKLSYTDKNGRAIFNCTVGSIEQNGIKAKKASACQFGLYGPTFTLIIPDFAPNAFVEKNFLYQKALEGEISPILEAFERCRLSRERESQICSQIEAKMEEGAENDYSVQEMIFALTHIRDMGNISKSQGEEQNTWKETSTALYQKMLEKLRKLDKVYLTIDKNTNYPFLNNGFVDVYTREEYAQLAVLFYQEQFRELEVRAMPVLGAELLKQEEGKPLAAQLPAFVLLYYLGMENILLDDGLYRVALSRGDVLPPPDHKGKPEIAIPVTNPALRRRILDFFGEARWKVNYEKRAAVLQAKEHAMLAEVARAKLLIPMKYEGAAQPASGMHQIVFDKDTKLMFAAIKNTAGENFTPVFTDFLELGKMYQPKDWGAAVISILDAIRINKGEGIAINPAGENLILKEKAIAALTEIMEQQKRQREAEEAAAQEPRTEG